MDKSVRRSVGVRFDELSHSKVYHYLIPQGWDIPSVGDFVVVSTLFGNAAVARVRRSYSSPKVGRRLSDFSFARIVEVNDTVHEKAKKEYIRAFSQSALDTRENGFIAKSKTRAQLEQEINDAIAETVRSKGVLTLMEGWNPKIAELRKELLLATD